MRPISCEASLQIEMNSAEVYSDLPLAACRLSSAFLNFDNDVIPSGQNKERRANDRRRMRDGWWSLVNGQWRQTETKLAMLRSIVDDGVKSYLRDDRRNDGDVGGRFPTCKTR